MRKKFSPKLTDKILARNLLRLRTDRGWNQEELAHRYDCDPSYISQLETLQRGFGAATQKRLCQIFAVPIQELLKMPDDLASAELARYWETFVEIQTGPRAEILSRTLQIISQGSPQAVKSLEEFLKLIGEKSFE